MLKLRSEIRYVLEKLNEFGEGYLVGGAVRDLLLGIEPSDFDFATNLSQMDVIRIFSDNKPKIISAKFQVTSIAINGIKCEIARFREDIGISNGRQPKNIRFISKIKEDLKRRDLTINALAYDIKNNSIIDLYGGIKDLKNRTIRMIGNASYRLEEDKIRILRIFKYVSKLNFVIDNNLFIELKKFSKKKDLFLNISKERLKENLESILLDKYSINSLKYMIDTNIIRQIFDIYCEKKDLKNIYLQLQNMYSNAKKYNLYNDLDIIYSSIFYILSKNINKNNINSIVNTFILKFGYSMSRQSDFISFIKFLNIISKKNAFNIENYFETAKIYNFKSENISKLFLMYKIINLNYKNKKKINLVMEDIQKFYITYSLIRDLEVNDRDFKEIFPALQGKINEVKKKIQIEIINKKLKNNKMEILNYISKKYKISFELEKENCAGAVIYSKINNKYKYLLVKVTNGNWGFSKGHIEENESLIETAIREVKEETNLDIEIIDSNIFFEKINYLIYFENKKSIKNIDYFLGKAKNEKDLKIDEYEIDEYRWLDFNKAYEKISYLAQKKVLLKAHLHLLNRRNYEK